MEIILNKFDFYYFKMHLYVTNLPWGRQKRSSELENHKYWVILKIDSESLTMIIVETVSSYKCDVLQNKI